VNAQYVPTGDGLIQKLVSAVQSKTAPDISWIHTDFMDKLVLADAIYRMDTFIGGPNGLSDEELSDFFPALLQNASWRDTLYALPMEATSLALVYNRDIFRRAGLDADDPPENWDEMLEIARRLTVDADGDGQIDLWGFYVPVYPASGNLNIWMVLQWTPFLWQAGGHIIDETQSRVLYNSDAGEQALTFWKTLHREVNTQGFGLAHDVAFASGRVAMILDGPWDLPRYKRLAGLDWAIAPLPEGPAGRATYLAGEQLAIFKQSRHPDEAWTFVKWVTSPKIQARFSAASGYLPVRRSTLTHAEYQDHLSRDPGLRAFVGQMPVARARRPIDYGHVEINRHIAEAIERAIIGDVDPRSALDAAAAKSNQLLRATPRITQ
jgi:multiple sugar transport system substrate-binding protein